MAGLGTFLVAIAAPITKKVLGALGIGLVSYAALSTALTAVLNQAKSAWGGLTGDALSLIGLSGATQALSIIAGALVARVAMQSLTKLEILR